MKKKYLFYVFAILTMFCIDVIQAQVTLESEIKITDLGLHFNGNDVAGNAPNTGDLAPYDFFFGRNISAHGDCIKTYKEYVFMTWYRGGKEDRHVMLTRYNTITRTMATIEFPHRHTGYQNRYWIGESHNTIAVGVSPLNGTIHLLYDMHSYDNNRPSDGSLSNDYFRYSFSIANAAALPDADFTLDKFVKNSSGGYKHLSLNGGEDYANFSALTYPKFFLNNSGDLFMYMREGGNNNGAYKFSKYNATTATWSNFTPFNILNARTRGSAFNWGLYGDIKYVNGKMRIGFQRRSSNNNDKYQYQNGVYYAFTDDQNGFTGWKNHQGQGFNLPLIDADFIKVMEPGDFVQGTNANSISIVSGFDWTVTENEDVHFISRVRDNQFRVTKNLHTYRPAGATEFITSESFSGAEELFTSGEDVYIIGLNSTGRVFVEKAKGGTNNFTRVYQATTGRVYDHGQIYISNGKLYYYLMEKKTGSAQPLYLQIIDLDLDVVQNDFSVSITSPSNASVFEIDKTIPITVNVINQNGSISKVAYKVNGVPHSENATAPYSINWTPTIAGNYTIEAIAYNQNNETVSSSEINVTIKANDPYDLSGTIYRIKNFVTGQYLQSVGSDVVESANDSNVAEGDKEWEFVKSGDFYNILSKRPDRGVLRSAGSPVGDIINTGFAAPNFDSDKQFTITYNSLDDTYQFKTRNNSNYIYHNTNGIVEHLANSDDRSKWIVESLILSVNSNTFENDSVMVFPNPASKSFTVVLKDLSVNEAQIVIIDMLGKTIYKNVLNNGKILIENNGRFKSGIYLVTVTSNKQSYQTKLVIK